MPPPIARMSRMATAMIAGRIHDGRSEVPSSTGRATVDCRPERVVVADSGTGVGTKVGRSELEAGVHTCSLPLGGGVIGSKYGACAGSGSLSGSGTYGAGAGRVGGGTYGGGSYLGGTYSGGSYFGGS